MFWVLLFTQRRSLDILSGVAAIMMVALYSFRFPYRFSLQLVSYSFGYVVEGADFLQDMKEGDIIKSAKVTSGLDLLKAPKVAEPESA